MNAEFVIVGGGVYGCAMAWQLARRARSVVLIDERGVASRASGGPGRRGVRANGRDLRELALMPRAYQIWPQLHEQLDAAPFYQRCGHLLLAERARDLPAMRAQQQVQQALGVRTAMLSADELREREPALSPTVLAALYCPDDGVADHTATTRAYARAAIAAGAHIETPAQACEVIVERGVASAVQLADGRRLTAECGVIVLANSGVAPLLAPWLALPVWNECLQVLVSEPMPSVPFTHLIGHWSRVVSLKTEAADRVMVSGGWHGRWDEATRSGRAIAQSIDANIAEAVAVCPALDGLRADVADANHLETMTPDRVPIIDRAAAIENLWFASGWCGHGWAIAPVVAELLADWIERGDRPPLLAPFALSRFGL